MDIKLPREYLSYSAIDLWCKNKEEYRNRYYRGIKPKDTPYTLFGREVHEKLENTDELQHIPRYPKAEIEIKTEIEGVPLLGYIDRFDPEEYRFLDYKTSIRNKDGSSKWNDVAVQKLDQLPFYSMLIKEKYGEVHPEAKLIWLETAWREAEYAVSSQMLTINSDELELTGHFEEFTREIEEWERSRMKEWIVEKAGEISEDYKAFL
jgi:hypothetical protein